MLRLLSLLLALTAFSSRLPAEDTAPFVAGFDRFGRHDQIDIVTAGRLLLSELSCTACHVSTDSLLVPKSAPRLDGVANRLDERWMRAFLAAPQALKPGTTMPDVLAGVPSAERDAIIDALLTFLGTQHEPWPEVKAGGANPVLHRFWDRGDADNGRRLYHTVGCVACHEADTDYETVEVKPSPLDEMLEQLDPEEITAMGLAAAVRPVNPVPHPEFAAKYSHQSLTYFLLQPETTRTAGRMPSLKLEPFEAADIAAWLLRQQRQRVTPPTAGTVELVARGRQLFGSLGCANCHSPKGAMLQSMTPLADIDPTEPQSCLGEPAVSRPHFPLDDLQRRAVQAALADIESFTATPAERSDFRLLQLNCYGCHEREGIGGVGRNLRPYFETVDNIDIGDEGRIPPPLTGVGRKLETAWLRKVLQGTGDLRPYMYARMPRFPDSAIAHLSDLLAQVDRQHETAGQQPWNWPTADNRGSTDPVSSQSELADAGRALMNVGCVQCHSFSGEALPGVVGIDLIGVPQRIRPGWFHEFLLAPGSLKNRTRMPSFFPAGRSQNPDILGGDPDRQIAAMWAYLKAGDDQLLPEKIETVRRQDFELKPSGRAIVLRSFMPEAGTRAIAVGLPAEMHYAFDAELLRLAQLWKGRFLDVQGAWFSRFAPPASPLGEAVVTLPAGPSLAWLSGRDQPWPDSERDRPGNCFRGYRLDADGVPTFLYEIGSVQVEEQINAGSEGVLLRHLLLTPQASDLSGDPQLWLRAAVGKELKVDGNRCTQQDGLNVSVTAPAQAELRNIEGTTEWLVPISLKDEPVTVEVQYQW